MIVLEQHDHADEFVRELNTELWKIFKRAEKRGLAAARKKAPVYKGPPINRKHPPVPGALRDAITSEVRGKFRVLVRNINGEIRYKVSGGWKLIIGIPVGAMQLVFYALWQEKGTKRQKKRPFLTPRALGEGRKIRSDMVDMFS